VRDEGRSRLLRVVETPFKSETEQLDTPAASVLRPGNLRSRRYGTALHRGLELLAGEDDLPVECPNSVSRALNFLLAEMSNPALDLTAELSSLVADMNRVLQDEAGRWILSARHGDAQAELALYLVDDKKQIVIDRTFIDSETGIRWIIDYKTSRPEVNTPLPDFFSQEAARYRDQLMTYRSAMQIYDQVHHPDVVDTRVALYFSALAEMYEINV
jgi:ATP-dependent exoDNAse (exonuclease V) beta subunit